VPVGWHPETTAGDVMGKNQGSQYTEDKINVSNGTQPQHIRDFVERRAKDPIIVEDKTVWNFNNHKPERDTLEEQVVQFYYDDFIIPFQASGAWAYMWHLLPHLIGVVGDTTLTRICSDTLKWNVTMKQEKNLKNSFERNCKRESLIYLMYESPESDKLSFPIRFCERYLTQGSCDATLQCIGPELQISVWTERKNILVRLAIDSWKTGRSYSGTISDLGGQAAILSIGRFEEQLRPQTYEDEDKLWIDGFVSIHQYGAENGTT